MRITKTCCSRVYAKYSAAVSARRGVTMRSIQRLAAELYGGNAHFLLEIVQNADDNKYPDGAVPMLNIDVRCCCHYCPLAHLHRSPSPAHPLHSTAGGA